VPSTESIHFIESDTARAGYARALGLGQGGAQKTLDAAPSGKLPLFIQFEDVPSSFVHITAHIGTSDLPMELKPLMSIFMDNFFNTPIKRNGETINFEKVVMELERDTVSYSLNSARYLGDADGIMIQMSVEPGKYGAAVDWIRTMAFDAIFDPVRIKAAITKALADVPEAKRDGRDMSAEIDAAIHLKRDTMPVAKRTLVKAVYLKRLKKLLEREPEKVLGWFTQLRNHLFKFENMRFLVTANLQTLPAPLTSWDALSSSLHAPKDERMMPIVKPVALLNDEGKNPGNVGVVIVPITSIESSFTVSTAPGLSSFSDPRVPAMMVAIGYLETVEGPLWNAVRGAGYAYGSFFSRNVDAGTLSYRVYRSPDAAKAIAASRDAIQNIANGTVPVDKHLLEGTVSQIVTMFADEQSTMPSAAQQNYIQAVVRDLPKDWSKEILRRVRAVTVDEMRQVMTDMIMPCFEPGKSNVVITCSKSMSEVSFWSWFLLPGGVNY
jgi:Zn-dependent M16 (insulinase) family peptidase